MAFGARIIPIQLSAATSGTVDFTDSGFGTPDAALAFLSGATGTSGTTNDEILSIGSVDAAGNRSCATVYAEYGAATSDCARAMSASQLLQEIDESSVEGQLDFTAFITDGIRCTYDSQFDQAYRGFLLVFRDLDDSHCDSATLTTSDLTITDPGFKPDVVFFYTTTGSLTSHSTNNTISFGWAIRDTSDDSVLFQTHLARNNKHNASTVRVAQISNDIEVMSALDAGSANYRSGACSGFTSTGFTLTHEAHSSTSDINFNYLALKLPSGIEAAAGSTTWPGSTGTLSLAPGFDSDAFLIMVNRNYGTEGFKRDTSLANSLCIGGADADSNQAVCEIHDDDGDTDMVSRSAFRNTQCVELYAPDSIIAAGDIDNTTTDIDIDVTTATVGQGYYTKWIAFETAPATNPEIEVTSGALTLTGGTIGLELGAVAEIDSSSLSLSGGTIGLELGAAIEVAGGALTLTGGTIGLELGAVLPVDAGALTLAGSDISVEKSSSYEIEVISSALTLFGGTIDLELAASPEIEVTSGSLTLTGGTIGLQLGAAIEVTSSALTLSGGTVEIPSGFPAVVDSSALTLSGGAIAIDAGYAITVDSAALDLAGSAIELTYSAAPSTLSTAAFTVRVGAEFRATGAAASFRVSGQ